MTVPEPPAHPPAPQYRTGRSARQPPASAARKPLPSQGARAGPAHAGRSFRGEAQHSPQRTTRPRARTESRLAQRQPAPPRGTVPGAGAGTVLPSQGERHALLQSFGQGSRLARKAWAQQRTNSFSLRGITGNTKPSSLRPRSRPYTAPLEPLARPRLRNTQLHPRRAATRRARARTGEHHSPSAASCLTAVPRRDHGTVPTRVTLQARPEEKHLRAEQSSAGISSSAAQGLL